MADAEVEGLPELVLLPEGAAFGNYVIHQCIGQGAMGNVYRAEHALLEKPVAIKVMDASLLSSGDARERFLREGQAAAAIKHPNVVDITDVGVFEGTPYLVMELLEGEDLQIYLQRQAQLSEREIASLLLPIAAALGAAHDRGVVHRDLKPSNIFLSRGPDGEIVPKILDFGISKIAHALASADFQSTPFNQLMGSPLYLPPEAVRGSRDLTAKSDQYSLGVVLYECATGRAPFAGDSLLSILNSIAAGEFMKPSGLRFDVSEVMERVILRAMNPDPVLRYDHVRDLGRELLEVAGVRTQMLWGRSFGRLDLAEPPLAGGTSTSPLVVMHPSDSSGSARGKRELRKVWLGVAAVIAISITSFWGMRAPPDGSLEAARARVPQTGEASLRPALDPARTAIAPAGTAAIAPPPPAFEEPIQPDEPSARIAASTPTRASDSARARSSLLARSATQTAAVDGARDGSASNAERPRPRRTRPVLAAEARAPSRTTLIPELRPRLVASEELAPEPYGDEMFPPMEPARDGSKPASSVATGANESPILD